MQPDASHEMAELQRETALDPVMVNLASVTLYGWLKSSESAVAEDLKPYSNVRDQLGTPDGVIYKVEKVVVPKSVNLIICVVSIWAMPVSNQPRKELEIFYTGKE